ncbi:MAG: hypothetical protein ISS34_08265, partial [Candidatus Omnitrophica bacterium]|nr:hypothetical protein [Candidatus Omnitrophota bacterium]
MMGFRKSARSSLLYRIILYLIIIELGLSGTAPQLLAEINWEEPQYQDYYPVETANPPTPNPTIETTTETYTIDLASDPVLDPVLDPAPDPVIDPPLDSYPDPAFDPLLDPASVPDPSLTLEWTYVEDISGTSTANSYALDGTINSAGELVVIGGYYTGTGITRHAILKKHSTVSGGE